MSSVDVDLEAALLDLAAFIRRTYQRYDAAVNDWKQDQDNTKAYDVVKLARSRLRQCESRISEAAALVPMAARVDLLDAAVRLRDLDRNVPRLITEAVAKLSAPDSDATEAVEDVSQRFKPPKCPKCGADSRVASTPKGKPYRYIKCKNEECAHEWKSSRKVP